MGVGEDDTLGEAIAVTVIATGFNFEQQNDIVNIEQKKIIHSLEDEQKLEQNLLKQNEVVPAFDFSTQTEEEVFEAQQDVPVQEDKIKIGRASCRERV